MHNYLLEVFFVNVIVVCVDVFNVEKMKLN